MSGGHTGKHMPIDSRGSLLHCVPDLVWLCCVPQGATQYAWSLPVSQLASLAGWGGVSEAKRPCLVCSSPFAWAGLACAHGLV